MPRSFRLFPVWLVIPAMTWALLGCEKMPPKKAISGAVTCGGEKATKGTMRFVPIRDVKGPPSTAYIVDGRYQLDQDRGIYPGFYRVEIMVQRKTGNKIPDRAFIGLTTDQWEPVSDLRYAGSQSPLQLEIASDSNVPHDFEVPHR